MPGRHEVPSPQGDPETPRDAVEGDAIGSLANYRRPRHLAKSFISGYITGNMVEVIMANSQKRAIQNYRSRLGERGLARFEVLGRDADRDLIRSLARRLSEDTPAASELRATVSKSIAGEPTKPGGILEALRRSPLVGAEVNLSRPREEGRKVDL